MKQFLEELKNKKRSLYQRDYAEMLGAYNSEKATTEGYNGRQILELIQNCDDEESEEVFIKLDRDNNTISISNLGTPFSEKGYRSLSISNLSSKTSKRKYIGNKGLGFRSIINWSNVIRIISNKTCLSFSKEIVQKEFNSLFDESQKEKILNEYNFAEGVIPMPFLALPEISDYVSTNHYTTTIEIQYKPEFYNDIIAQIKNITPETLLFLHNINEIKFENIDDIENLKRSKELLESNSSNEFGASEKITVNKNVWNIFNLEEEIDEVVENSNTKEPEFYQLKLALKEDLSDSFNRLFSYFPTNVGIELPFIIHGTFDLDQNRNQLNQTLKNKYVIRKLVELIVKTAKYLSKDCVDWNPLQLLTYKRKNIALENLGFYALIDEAIEKEALFPCIDNTYRRRSEAIYLDDEFSKVIIENQGQKYFSELLIPVEKIIDLKNYKFPINGVISNPVYRVDSLSNEITDIYLRANFIKCINEHFPQTKFNLLIDNQGKLIKKEADIFTPSKKELSIPSFSDIKIIDDDLYERLIVLFKLTEARDKSRELQRILKQNTNIHSFEPIPLAEKIISSTNEAIKLEPLKQSYFISEMTKSLFENYRQQRENTRLDPNTNVPLLNKEGNIMHSKNLYISEFYKSGELTVDLFKDIYDQHEFLAPSHILGIIEEDNETIERFFLWLGVNKFVKYEKEYTKDFSKMRDYLLYLTKKTNFSYPNQIDINILKVSKLKEILTKLNIERIITWIFFDNEIKRQLGDINNIDKISYCINAWRELTNKPSFLKFALNSGGYNFDDHLIDEKYDWINTKQVNYSDELFVKYNISKREIDNILISLGATDDFSSLSIERISDVLEQLPIKYPDGRNSQALYKKALRNSQKIYQLKREIELFAHNGDCLKLYKPKDVFFSDTIKIPIKLRKKYPIFNFPLRSGGKEAIDFFQINDLKSLKININQFVQNIKLTSIFKELFERLKPYILAYRIEKIEKDSIRKQELYKLNNINFILCNQVVCNINEVSFEIEKHEFITAGNSTYYIKVDNSDSLTDLQSSPIFTGSFSEILANVFDVVGDKNEFRSLIKDDIIETDYYAREQLGTGLLTESRELLGFSDYTLAFWQSVFSTIGRRFNFRENNDTFLAEIKSSLGLNLNIEEINYEIINKIENIDIVKALFNQLMISIEDFNKSAVYALNLKNFHKEKLKAYFYSQAHFVKSSLWNSLKSESIKERSNFLNLISTYENHNSYIDGIAERNKTEFEIDIEVLFNEFVYSKLNKLSMVLEDIDFESILKENKKLFSEQELIEVNANTSLKSLMYFSDSLLHIKEEIKEEILDEDVTTENEPNSVEYKIIKPKKFKTSKLSKSLNGYSNGAYTHSSISDHERKQLGNTSEEIVYNELVKLYGKSFVSWKAKEDEGLHYDIRYSNDKGVKWKYAEVKTFSNSRFYLSKDEKEFGEANQSNYEIWLVNGNNIIPITDFFSNENCILNPKDYIVSLQIEF